MKKENINWSVAKLIVTIIMLVVVVVGGTFAWFTYSSRQSALVLTISDIHDSRIKITPYQINETIIPSTTYTGGVYSNVEIISQYENMPVKLFYKINSLDAIIIDNGLAYTIVNVETDEIIANDYFSNLIDTSLEIPNEVTILDDIIPVSKYRVYLWLDSFKGNQNEVVNTTLDMELNASIGYEDFVVILNENGGSYDSLLFTTVDETQYTVPLDGTYKLEVWGAQGGKSLNNGSLTTAGGYGGYSVGTVNLDEGTILHVNVGGQGGNGVKLSTASGGYNGGGSGSSDGTDDEGSGGGGGATHISTVSGVLSSLSSKKDSILIVAGGGGGASWTYAPGHGGGIYGGTTSVTSSSYPTQTSGYSFGQGQNGSGVADSDGVAGGGGGYYGGYSNNVSGKSSGTGGSGYIGNSLLTNKAMYCYNCTTSNDASTLTYSTTNVSSTPTENYAKSGNGSARITMLNASKAVTSGLTYGTLPTPTRDGYTFKEWNTKEDGSGETITSSSIVNLTGDTILYAVWEKLQIYTISYNANGGSGAPSAQTKYHDTALTLSSTKPTRNGYTFLGWSTSSTATSATYQAGGSYTDNAGATLYAVWKVGVLYLYNYGTEYTDITGSLVSALRAIDSEQDVTQKPSIIKNTDSIRIDHQLSSSDYSAVSGIAYWNKKIDLTNYSTLTFKGTLSGHSTWRGVAVWSTLSGHVGNGRVKQITSLTNGTGTVDISGLTGSYYIGFWVYESAPYVTMNYLALS